MVKANLLSLDIFLGQLNQQIVHFVKLHPILRQLGSNTGFLLAGATPTFKCWVGPICFASGRLIVFRQLDWSPGRKAIFGGWRRCRSVPRETQGTLEIKKILGSLYL